MHKKAGSYQISKRAVGSASSSKFTLGLSGIAKLNAVEGIQQSASSRAMFKQFERDGLTAADRRSTIVARHKKG